MKLIGDKKFYRNVFKIALPIVIQSALTYMVGFVDNIMVGQIGTEAMSGVAISNQLHHVFYTCLVGIVASGSIFGSQFYGKNDINGLKETFKFRFLCCFLLSIIAMVIFFIFGEQLISLFLHSKNNQASIEVTLLYGKQYLTVLLIGFIPFSLTQVYVSTIKDMGETLIPMYASIVAIISNTVFNYFLIFGKFGFPELGVEGAAIATVIARILEFSIVFIWVHIRKNKFTFIIGAFSKFSTNRILSKQIIKKGLPLMINEFCWSIGSVIMIQCYSLRGINVVAGLNIATAIYNMFTVIYMSIGGSVAIIIGQLLGAGKMKEARDSNNKLFFLAITGSVIFGILLFIIAPVLPQIYNTSAEVRSLATNFMYVLALCLPISAFTHVAFFTIRAGGNSIVSFLYDSLNLWIINIPLAFCLTRFTVLPIIYIYFVCQAAEIIKLIAGVILVKRGGWLKNIVNYESKV